MMLSEYFNRASSSYNENSHVQKKINDILLLWVINSFPLSIFSILELGCGDGYFSYKLFKSLKLKRYDGIDFSSKLIHQAKLNLERYRKRINFHNIDFNFQLNLVNDNYDLIYSSMALHWSNFLVDILFMIKKKMSINGLFIFSIPLYGTFHELKGTCRINKFDQNAKIKEYLSKTGYKVLKHDVKKIKIFFPSYVHLFKYLRELGVNYYNGTAQKETFANLKKNILAPGTVSLTYVIGLYKVK